jgi:hypothetical protein
VAVASTSACGGSDGTSRMPALPIRPYARPRLHGPNKSGCTASHEQRCTCCVASMRRKVMGDIATCFSLWPAWRSARHRTGLSTVHRREPLMQGAEAGQGLYHDTAPDTSPREASGAGESPACCPRLSRGPATSVLLMLCACQSCRLPSPKESMMDNMSPLANAVKTQRIFPERGAFRESCPYTDVYGWSKGVYPQGNESA